MHVGTKGEMTDLTREFETKLWTPFSTSTPTTPPLPAMQSNPLQERMQEQTSGTCKLGLQQNLVFLIYLHVHVHVCLYMCTQYVELVRLSYLYA